MLIEAAWGWAHMVTKELRCITSARAALGGREGSSAELARVCMRVQGGNVLSANELVLIKLVSICRCGRWDRAVKGVAGCCFGACGWARGPKSNARLRARTQLRRPKCGACGAVVK